MTAEGLYRITEKKAFRGLTVRANLPHPQFPSIEAGPSLKLHLGTPPPLLHTLREASQRTLWNNWLSTHSPDGRL